MTNSKHNEQYLNIEVPLEHHNIMKLEYYDNLQQHNAQQQYFELLHHSYNTVKMWCNI